MKTDKCIYCGWNGEKPIEHVPFFNKFFVDEGVCNECDDKQILKQLVEEFPKEIQTECRAEILYNYRKNEKVERQKERA